MREVGGHQIDQHLKYQQQFTNVILIPERIFPKVKAEIRELNSPFLETNGYICIRNHSFWFWIDTNRRTDTQKKSGIGHLLKVLFNLLLHKHNVHHLQRLITQETGVAFGNISLAMNGLKEVGYLLKSETLSNRIFGFNELDLLKSNARLHQG